MHRIIAVTLLLVVSTVSTSFAVEMAVVKPVNRSIPGLVGYAPDRIVVKFDPSTVQVIDKGALARGRTGVADLDEVGVRHGVASIKAQFPEAREKAYKGRKVDLSGWHKVQFAGKADIHAAVADYKKLPGVVEAQPVSIHAVYGEPNDQFYPFNANGYYQWHLPKIGAPAAWDVQAGNAVVTVAVLDTGVAYFAKDLGGANASYANPADSAGNMWINWGEKNRNPNIDDDGNGKIDDWIGWDFVQDTTVPSPDGLTSFVCVEGEDCGGADNDPRDFNGHGTHCAGSVGAMSNNGYAVASVAGGWGDGNLQVDGNGVRVMPLRIGWSADYYYFWFYLGQVGLVAMDYAAEALRYAADNGARIATCSWGSENTGGIDDAIDYFLASGGLIFKAAGNDGTETADHLCSRTDVICVVATDQNDCKASFSTYGTWADISAPGVSVLSLFYVPGDPATDYVTQMDGTSMASPLAAAVAALIWSQHPDWSADQVKQQLYAGADPIDSLACNASYDGKLGAGRINAARAVSSSPPAPQPPAAPTGLTATAASSSQINLAWADNANNEAGFRVERSPDGVSFAEIATVGANVTSYANTGLAANTAYFYRVRAYSGALNSNYSNTARATTQPLPAPPVAPTSLAASVVSSSQIHLTWFDNSGNEAGFEIWRCKGANCTRFSRTATVGANVASYEDRNLNRRTTYRYRVRAYNGAGFSAYSNTVGATTPR